VSAPVAAVVTCQDHCATLHACVTALRSRAGTAAGPRIVVADCGSSDGSLAVARAIPGVEVVAAGDRNVAAVFNRAVAGLPRGTDVVRVRGDVVVRTDGWLVRLLHCAAARPDAGAFGVRLLHCDGRIRSVGRDIVTGVGAHPRHANRRQWQQGGGSGQLVEVDAVPAAFAFYRRAVFDAVGGLDEGYGFDTGDDDDYCLAVRRRGHAVLVDGGIEATDLSPASSPTTNIQDRDLRERLEPLALRETVVRRAQARRFASKWGFDLRHPDLDEVRRRWGHTAICWRIGERMRWRPSCAEPPVDVVIVTWNNRALLARCLESVAATLYPAVHVHVADNGSTDGTLELLEQLRASFPFPLQVHALPLNTGVAVGFNLGIVRGDGELVARLDDDVIVPPDWLAKLVETMHRRPFAGCVGPKIQNDDARRTIQCGPFRMFPAVWAHADEDDQGQADYVARTVHVRGCCNLYRRDVLAACGLFDLRYSPSQWDDPDHHVALGVAGYEVLYDGRVGVVHAVTSGKGRSWPAVTNQLANADKLLGKWGNDVWQVLDTALDLSRLGRLLPPDVGAATRAALPAPGDFPSACGLPVTSADDQATKFVRYQRIALDRAGPLAPLWQDALHAACAARRDGHARRAADLLHSLLDFAPAWSEAILELARCYADLAQPDEVERQVALLRELCRAPELLAAADGLAAAALRPRAGDAGDAMHAVGERRVLVPQRASGSPKHLRVLMTNTYVARCAGGDMLQIRKTKQYLERLGVEVEVAHRPHPDPTGFDVVHAFNLWFPAQVLPQVRGIRAAAPEVPIVLTPIYWSMSEKNWAERAVPLVFRDGATRAQRDALLAALADGSLQLNGARRGEAEAGVFPGFEDYQRAILGLVDWLLPQSECEQALLQRTFGTALPHTIVRNAAERAVFEGADPGSFRRATGLSDFVLTVGLVEVRKNQLLLLEALRDTGLPVVVVGRNYDAAYLRACRQVAAPGTLFLEHLPHEQLASAMRAARVFALPSWMECAAFASLEAAVAGCQLVVGNRTSEREYFGDAAYYADPADVRSIRDAVVTAWQRSDADSARRRTLQERCARDYTWEQVAAQTLAGYEAALAARGRTVPPPGSRGSAQRSGGSALVSP
jgi:GT2 family glycosyltransferase/glycosyltransferase involved in cell wall biosynthesis